MSGLTPQSFATKWQDSELKERSGSQEHFIDLCRMLGHGTPAQLDPKGDFFTFEKGAEKQGGGDGWADVWYRGHFAWEYKGKHANLEAAYSQLLKYREYLESPPLLIVSDMDRFEVHCNFTGLARRTYRFDLKTLAEGGTVEIFPPAEGVTPPTALYVLQAAFTDPDVLQAKETTDQLTKFVAGWIGQVANDLRLRKIDPAEAARFLMKVLFCFFAEDVRLLPEKIFTGILKKTRKDPDLCARYTGELFEAMAHGGHVLLEKIAHFDGGLFADSNVIKLRPAEIDLLYQAGKVDWSNVEPAIFGTLFERCLDPDKHAQIGRHYTYADDIAAIVEPVLFDPLQGEWENLTNQIAKIEKAGKNAKKIEKMLRAFQDFLASLRVLDPACGSGNFLYVALRRLMDLEKKVVNFAFRRGVELPFKVRPTQLHGMEINRFAHELASVVVWIGYLQWMRDNGAPELKEPILDPIETIYLMDAIVGGTGLQPVPATDKPKKSTGCKPVPPQEPDWPDADFIIGNPPFLGGKKLRDDSDGKNGLGDKYVDDMFKVWSDRVPRESDLCCYWFEKARAYIEAEAKKKHYVRAGLLATQGIRGGANRTALQRIKETGDIFMAWSDRPWVLDGATVHVSMVGFDDGTQKNRSLDGETVIKINPDLSAQADITQAQRLPENLGVSFMGDIKGGIFDITDELAREMLSHPNPSGKPNSDVIRPWVNGRDITQRPRNMSIIDFGVDMPQEEAALYEAPFEYVREHVQPMRIGNRMEKRERLWWIHADAAPRIRKTCLNLPQHLATPRVAKHRLFVWLRSNCLPDAQLIVFARSDDYFFGVLQSRVHEVWSDAQGTQLREKESGRRYTPTTCFETFPFPWPANQSDVPADKKDIHARISAAAARLNELRENWINPEPGSISAQDMKKRTLTKLYNKRPTWLENACAELDAAVLEAYGWPTDISNDEILGKLLELNLARAAT